MVELNKKSSEEILYDKMLTELREYRETLLQLAPQEILDSFVVYELTYKEDILLCFEHEELELTENDIYSLSQMEKPLDWLYQLWNDNTACITHNKMLVNFIKTALCRIERQ